MDHRTTQRRALTLGTLVLFTAAAVAKDVERVAVWRQNPATSCPGPFERWERWSAVDYQTSGVPWRLYADASGAVVPGLPPASGNPVDAPGYDAVLAAATVWNDIPAWTDECPPTASPTEVVSAFRYAATPTLCGASCGPDVISGDGVNTVTFFDTNLFSGMGGAALLGYATVVRVDVNVALTQMTVPQCQQQGMFECWPSSDYARITEMDIAINALSTSGNVRTWGWVAWETGGPYVSEDTPLYGFGDIQGVLTHAFGHGLGMGHSLVDSVTAPGTSGQGTAHSAFPTMFVESQGKTFHELVYQDPLDPAETPTLATGMVFGTSARSLEPDDVAAVGRAYPSSTFASGTGSIEGRVIDGTTGLPVLGVSVVAIAKGCPERNRVGTLTYGSPTSTPTEVGVYKLSGLAPGTYYVYAEPVDRLSYFPGFLDVPEYVVATPPTGIPTTMCCHCWMVGGADYQAVAFHPEFYNTNDKRVEDPQRATEIQVTAGPAGASHDVVIDPVPSNRLRLEVAEVGSGLVPVTRGVVVDYLVPASGGGTMPNQVEFTVLSKTAHGGASVEVVLSYDLANSMPLLDLWQLDGFQEVLSGTLDANGDVTLAYELDARDQYRNVFAQARITVSDGGASTELYTNVVNVWVHK